MDYPEVAQAMWLSLHSVAWLEWAKAVFDLIKGIAWPLAIFAIVYLFRLQLRERIRDLLSVGREGVVFQPTQPVRQETPEGLTSVKPDDRTLELQSQQHPLSTVQPVVAKIRGQLETLPEEQRIPELVISLAVAQIERQFEMIWGLIFQSQITALHKLRELGAVPISEAEEFFEEQIKPHHPEFRDWNFGQWSNFLLVQELVRVEHGSFAITDAGRDFLFFVEHRKRGLYRGL